MKNAFRMLRLVAVLFLLTLAHPASAELVLAFSGDDGATFGSHFQSEVGQSMTIGIFLQESAPGNVLSSDGLIAFGIEVDIASQSGTLLEATPDSRFDVENHQETTASGFSWEYADSDPVTDLASTVRLGTLEYQPTTDGTSVFTVGDRLIGGGISNASWLTPNLDVLDEQIFGADAANSFQFSITTTAIPEPNVSFVCLLAGWGLLIRRRRSSP